MPFYLIEQKGVPGARLVEADKPQQAMAHVIGTSFDCKRVDNRELLDAAKVYEVEVAGVDGKPAEDEKQEAGDNPGLSDHREEADENLEALR